MKIDPELYRKTFFDEAAEHLASLEAALLRLDSGKTDAEAVAEAFRAVHSMKGGADAVGLPEIVRYAHVLENVFERFRSNCWSIPRKLLDTLLKASDILARLISSLKNGGLPPPGIDGILSRLSGTGDNASTALSPTNFTVIVRPHSESLRSGLDPVRLLGELCELGTTQVTLDCASLPALAELDPERCYLSWKVALETSHERDSIAEIFSFAGRLLEVQIEAVKPLNPKSHTQRADSIVHSTVTSGPEPLQFAAHLVKKKLVTAEKVLEVLELQQQSRPLLGRLAIEAGRMTIPQVWETMRRTTPSGFFADTAIRLGYLQEADLGPLLVMQARQTMPIAEALVAKGVVDRASLERELQAFRGLNARSDSLSESLCAVSAVSLPSLHIPAAPRISVLNENSGMIADFCSEATDHLEAADRHLLTIDADPTSSEALNAVYRGFHTIKGVASMLGLSSIQMLAHEAENLLNLAREGKLLLRGKPLDLAFASVDALKRQVGFLRHWMAEGGKIETDAALPELIGSLRKAVAGNLHEEGEKEKKEARSPTPGADKPAREEREVAPHVEAGPSPEPLPAPAVAGTADRAKPRPGGDKETVRVDRDRLDKLINSIGELVIAQSMAQEEYEELTRNTGTHSRSLTELSKICRNLQEQSLSLRMVPLQGTFQKMTRLVRDLSRKINKPVELELHGEETELDKTVVDQLGDPLMHMVRNAIDHGLESPEERIAAGKPAEGKLTLRGFHQGGNVYLELSDDGKGLDRERILRKGVEKGLISDSQRLSDSEVYALIFEPGFSTAKAVTDVSGRGVGMDVVRRNVQALQGSIHIRTQVGLGTTFTIRLPLTLAIMDGLMVGLGNDVYVLPLVSVVESFRPQRGEVHTITGRGEVVAVRSETVPLLRLYRILGRTSRVEDPCQGIVVLVEEQGKKHALLVDELLGQMQAVVKSLDANFRQVEGLAGATILGDGRVAMILDVHGLGRLHSQT